MSRSSDFTKTQQSRHLKEEALSLPSTCARTA